MSYREYTTVAVAPKALSHTTVEQKISTNVFTTSKQEALPNENPTTILQNVKPEENPAVAENEAVSDGNALSLDEYNSLQENESNWWG